MSDNNTSSYNKIIFSTLSGIIIGSICSTIIINYYNNKKIKNKSNTNHKNVINAGDDEQELQLEQFKRNIQFVGDDEFNKLVNSKIVIVGLGGTGSHAAHLLARSGAGFLRLIDLDQVSLSSLNRHAVASRADVGKSKVEVMKEYLLQTIPSLECECIQDIFSKENGHRLLFSSNPLDLEASLDFKPDFVIDCIDNVETKAFLLAECKNNNIPVITTCGAGCRSDPTRFTICDISDAHGDPLLKATKNELKKHYKIYKGIPCLYSNEKPPRKLLPFTENDEDPSDYSTLPDIHMRVRIIPVLGPMPAIWGNALAMYVINIICNQPFNPQPIEYRGSRYWDAILQRIRKTEVKHCNNSNCTLNKDDAIYIIEYRWNYNSAYSNKPATQNDGLTIVRWDKNNPLTLNNGIPLLQSEVQKYYSNKLQWTDNKKQNIILSFQE